MPIYEFRCVQCGNIQEILTSSSSQQVDLKCEQCQGETMERVLSRVSYTMGSSGGASGSDKGSSPCVTTKTCGPGKSCSTIELPGYSK